MENLEIARDLRAFLRSSDAGILSTIKDQDGESFPYGSVCPFYTSKNGEIVILVSDIALHTKNMKTCENVSFTVLSCESSNKQASPRASILCKAQVLSKEDSEFLELSESYYNIHPESRRFSEFHDFNFYKLVPTFCHYIKGFGKIYKMEAKDYLLEDGISFEQYKGAIDHMNDDHQSAITKYLNDIEISDFDKAQIISINSEGFHIKYSKEDTSQISYLSFKSQAKDLGDIRKMLVEMAKS